MNSCYIFRLGLGQEGAHAGDMSAMKIGAEPASVHWEKIAKFIFSREYDVRVSVWVLDRGG